jgi:C4-type Zn-finger protein
MNAACPHCGNARLDFKVVELPIDHTPDKPWVLLAETPCPNCGWRVSFGRFSSKEEAETFKPET